MRRSKVILVAGGEVGRGDAAGDEGRQMMNE
jgi:hypothetical protein